MSWDRIEGNWKQAETSWICKSTAKDDFDRKKRNYNMNFSKDADLVLCVLRGQNDQWQVSTQDLRHALATFDNPHAACAWAIARAKPKQGRVFIEELATNGSVALDDHINAPGAFNFSIPVTWTESKDSRFTAARG